MTRSIAAFIFTFLVSFANAQAPKVNARWQVAFERDGNIWISNADGSHQNVLVKYGAFPKWSPDGRKLAFYRKGSIWIFDMRSKKEHRAFAIGAVPESKPYNDHVYISWDPKESVVLASKTGDMEVTAYLPKGVGEKRIQHLLSGALESYVGAPTWSPSGKWLAFSKNGDVWIARRDPENKFEDDMGHYYGYAYRLAPLAIYSDEEMGVSDTTPYWVGELMWMGDRRLVFHFQRQGGSGVSQIGFLDLTRVAGDDQNRSWDKWSGFTYKARWILDFNVYSPRVCPDGKTLSYVGFSDDVPWLYVCDWDGKQRHAVMKDVFNPDWRPLGP